MLRGKEKAKQTERDREKAASAETGACGTRHTAPPWRDGGRRATGDRKERERQGRRQRTRKKVGGGERGARSRPAVQEKAP